MLYAVVFDGDLPFPPTHIDANTQIAEHYLRFWYRQSAIDQDEPQLAFLR